MKVFWETLGSDHGFAMTWNAWTSVVGMASECGFPLPESVDFCHGGEMTADESQQLRAALGRSESLHDHELWLEQFRDFLTRSDHLITIDHRADDR